MTYSLPAPILCAIVFFAFLVTGATVWAAVEQRRKRRKLESFSQSEVDEICRRVEVVSWGGRR